MTLLDHLMSEVLRMSMCFTRYRLPMALFPHWMHAVLSSYTGVGEVLGEAHALEDNAQE